MRRVAAVATVVLTCSCLTATAAILENADWESNAIPQQWKLSYSNSREIAQSVELQPSVGVATTTSDYPIAACSGNRGLKFQLTYRDDRSGFRNELALIGPNKQWNYGVDYWLGWAIYLPENYAVDSRSDTLLQFHGVPDKDSSGNLVEPSRHPPIALYTGENGRWTMRIKGDSKKISTSVGSSTRVASYSLGDFRADRGRWTEFVMHVRFHYNSTGLVEVWKDGVKVVTDRGENTYNDNVPPFLKIGIYKPAWKPNNWGGPSSVPSRLFFYDAVKVGRNSSFAEVAPQCGGLTSIPEAPVLAE